MFVTVMFTRVASCLWLALSSPPGVGDGGGVVGLLVDPPHLELKRVGCFFRTGGEGKGEDEGEGEREIYIVKNFKKVILLLK